MTNQQIIAAIKKGEAAGIDALASKYGITREQAEQIAEQIAKKNAHSIMKRANRHFKGFEILVGWHGYGYLGGFDTHTHYLFNSNGSMFSVIGEV